MGLTYSRVLKTHDARLVMHNCLILLCVLSVLCGE